MCKSIGITGNLLRILLRILHGILLAATLSTAIAHANESTGVANSSGQVLLRNGLIVDGTGAPPYFGDLRIRDGLIVELLPAGPGRRTALLPAGEAISVIDAKGRIIAPGFIDPHSHGNPIETPAFENFLAMGVTTITLGQDGSSPPPGDIPGWQHRASEFGIAPNIALFVGHGTLRSEVGIGTSENPTPDQLDRLAAALDRALDHTFGLSTGLEYTPGLFAGAEELERLARVVGERQRIIMSHLRNEDDDQLRSALNELLAQGAHARVHVSHLKSVYGKGAGRGEEILGWLAEARASGIDVSADVYPYSASYTGIGLLFPKWAKSDADFARARLERREELATYLRERVNRRNGPEATVLGTDPYRGQTLADLAIRFNQPFEEVLIDQLGPSGFSAAYFVMNDTLQRALFQDRLVAVSSDGSPTGFHPRGHGTHAKIIQDYVVGSGELTLADAVHKMTALPASLIGITDRGRLLPGMAADIIVFDPKQVRAGATYTEPLTLAEGFDLVFVNGTLVRAEGELTGAMPGVMLKPAAEALTSS